MNLSEWGTDCTQNELLNQLVLDVGTFVNWILQHHTGDVPRGPKVIHDGVWGTNKYNELEVALINTPLIQRLRNIHQTAYTLFTYPSSNHTRFDHTLGVTAQVGKLFTALESKFSGSNDCKKNLLNDLQTLRAGALMHDCGHGPLSHTSEEVYRNYPEIKLLKKINPFKPASAHEALSSLIVLSEGFSGLLDRINRACCQDINKKLLVEAICGHVSDDSSRYKVDFLNGPFDADKLDYLFRDGHFSGLPMRIDLDRLWYAIDINTAKEQRRLTVDWGGTSSLEQIMFAKMTLYPAVYHHHKVRSCDCMFKGIVEYLSHLKIPFSEVVKNTSDKSPLFSKAIHFLYFDDYSFFEILDKISNNEKLHQLIHNLKYRRLLKRCVVISQDTIEEEEALDEYIKYREIGDDFYRGLAKEILDKSGVNANLEEVWVDCPKDPSFESAGDTWISPLDGGECTHNLTNFFNITQWATQYKHRKWRSHVFCPPEHVDVFARTTEEYFKSKFGMKFKKIAFELCHVNSPI